MLHVTNLSNLQCDSRKHGPNCLQDSNSEDALDERREYEDEAEESDADFIDDDEPDESDSDAADMTHAACNALRNRQSFRDTALGCPLCQDMRVVMRHLLGLE